MVLVMRNYWWPEITKNVGRYVEGCDMCQRVKNRTEIPAEKLKLSEVLEKPWIYKPWIHLTVDFIAKLLVVARKDIILVVCNRLSKMMYFVATIEGTSCYNLKTLVSRSLMVDFIFYFLFSLYFIFLLLFLFFSIFRTTWVRVYSSHCHISHKLMA